MLKKIPKSVSILLGTLFFVWAIYFVAKDHTAIAAMRSANVYLICGLFLLQLLFIFSNSECLRNQLKVAEINMTPNQSFLLNCVVNAGNTFLPLSAGLVFRAKFLKEKYSLSLANFVSLTIGGYIGNYLVVFFAGSVATLSLALFGFSEGSLTKNLTFTLSLSFFGLALALLYLPRIVHQIRFIPAPLRGLLHAGFSSWIKICQNKNVLLGQLLFSWINVLLSAGMLALGFKTFGVPFGLLEAVLLSVLNSLAIFIKLTPANLGVTEALLLAGAQLTATDLRITLMVSALLRVTQLTSSLALFPICGWLLLGKNWFAEIKTDAQVSEQKGSHHA